MREKGTPQQYIGKAKSIFLGVKAQGNGLWERRHQELGIQNKREKPISSLCRRCHRSINLLFRQNWELEAGDNQDEPF